MVRKNATMADAPFEVISDDERGPAGGRRLSPWVQALFDGKTIKLGIEQGRLGGYYKTAERHGFKLRSRAVEGGTIVWADPIEELNGK
jgi:hypothetical protein